MKVEAVNKLLKRDERQRELDRALHHENLPQVRRLRIARLITGYSKWLCNFASRHVSEYKSDSEPRRI